MNDLDKVIINIEIMLANKAHIIERATNRDFPRLGSILLEHDTIPFKLDFTPFIRACGNMDIYKLRSTCPLNNPEAIAEMSVSSMRSQSEIDGMFPIVAYLCYKFIKIHNIRGVSLGYPIQEPEGVPFWATEMRWQYVEFVKAELTYYRDNNKVMGFR